MDYFSKFLRPAAETTPKAAPDYAQEFEKAWTFVKNTLLYPDERQLSKGILSTAVPARLQSMVDALVAEATLMEAGATGPCMEHLLQNDILGTLVKLSETDRPSGIQAEVLRAVQNMVVLLDEQFLAHTAVHKAILRLLRNCVGDDVQEQLDGRKIMGAAGNAARSQPSEYEEDLVHLLCILCSRIRNYRELLIIFFHDKHWFRSEPLFSVEEENEGEESEDEDSQDTTVPSDRSPSPSPSQATIKSAPVSSVAKKAEYEFLLFNYLLRFVHREGKIGDFARAGLLFLMDVAMSPGQNPHSALEDGSSPSTAESAPTDPNADAALALAEYIVDGDFSEVLGAGLAAVYSLLPSKLEIKQARVHNVNANASMVIGSSGPETEDQQEERELTREKNQALGLEESTSPDFKVRLDHFLKLLEFLQDILRRNVQGIDETLDPSTLVGNAIANSILDAVRRTFLENVLYPSILECSDADGSAVAVMSYIETMITTLRPDELANLLVEFLVSEDNEQIVQAQTRRQPVMTLGGSAPPQSRNPTGDKDAKARRRQSMAMTLLEMEAPDSTKPSEYFTSMERFTLKDLLLTNLRSDSQPTAAAAFQLLQTMLVRHCQLCVDKLLIVSHDPNATSFPEPLLLHDQTTFVEDDDDDETFVYPGMETSPPEPFKSLFPVPQTTISTHEREMNLYLTLVSRVDPSHADDAFSTGYENYLRDALQSIEEQPCFHSDMDLETRSKRKHRLNPNDPILSSVLESLRTFFANAPEFNIALTGVLATLALCPDRSLAGWLTFALKDPGSWSAPALDDTPPDDDSDGDDRSIDFTIEEQLATEQHQLPAASVDEQSRPVVHTVFLGLVSQLERYRQQVDDFDKYLLERRQGLLFSENLTDALTLVLEPEVSVVAPTSVTPRAETPQPKARPTMASSLVSFLTPRKAKPSATPSGTTSDLLTSGDRRQVDASPFAPHYKHTSAITVEPYTAPVPSTGPWTPAKKDVWPVDEDDVFSSSGQWADSRGSLGYGEGQAPSQPNREGRTAPPKRVTLSHLLDNVVVLEESMKELVAIIQARRSLGIDSLRYI